MTERKDEGGSLLDAGLRLGPTNENLTTTSGEKRLVCSACDSPHCEHVYSCSNAVMVSRL